MTKEIDVVVNFEIGEGYLESGLWLEINFKIPDLNRGFNVKKSVLRSSTKTFYADALCYLSNNSQIEKDVIKMIKDKIKDIKEAERKETLRRQVKEMIKSKDGMVLKINLEKII